MKAASHVVIPFGASDPHRIRALEYVRACYADDGLRVVVADSGGDSWSKGASIDAGVRASGAHLLVIADADVLVLPSVLADSVAAVRNGAAWSQPHNIVLRAERSETDRILAGRLKPHLARGRRHRAASGGGIVVLTREAYDASGGMDPRFVGWGGDDVSWARALDTLAGPCARLCSTMVHLWHPPSPRRPGRRGSEHNEAVAAKYLEAAGDRKAMLEVVGRR